MQILNIMTLLLEQNGHTIHPHSEALVQYLPHLWQESEDHNMLRCAIVSTLVQVVKAVGGVRPELGPFLLPIIQLGTDTTQPAIVYLLEDCLELWLTTLEYSSSMTNELMQLFNNMPQLLGKHIKLISIRFSAIFSIILLKMVFKRNNVVTLLYSISAFLTSTSSKSIKIISISIY